MIVVTAPTGNIGHRVVNDLLERDEPLRVIVRDPARLSDDVRGRVEVVTGSHGDPAVLGAALDGAEALFWLLPTDSGAASVDDAYLGFTRPAARVIRERGVARVVDVTALGRGTPHEAHAGYVTASLAMDDLLADSATAFRGVAAASFMDNLARQVVPIATQGVFYDVLSPDLALPTVATRDIAATAAALLADDTWTGRDEVPVLGPENLSMNDQARIAGEVLGTPVRYQQIPRAGYVEQMTSHGLSPAMAQALLDMMVAKDEGLDLGVTRTPQNAIDTPTTFRQWCTDVLAPAVRAA